MKIIIINGPNLNLLGKREPSVYGSQSMESYLPKLRAMYLDADIEYYQSNVEGELVEKHIGRKAAGGVGIGGQRGNLAAAGQHHF